MAAEDDLDRIWTIADKIDPCMLVTREDEGARVRPVYARVRRDEGRIYILTDTKGVKLDQIAANPRVSLAFADIRGNSYVVVDGAAEARHDPAKARELWRFTDDSFWDGPDDPELRVITVVPSSAELWDGGNLIVSGVKILAERLAGAEVRLVETAKVEDL